MKKYIDSEKLIAEINNRLMSVNLEELRNFGCHRVWAYNDVKDLITSLQQEQPEVQNGKFVFPKYLYARTKDNKTIDMSYAPQDMTAIEYVRNDFVQQEQPDANGDDGKFVKILVRKEYAEQFQRLSDEIQAGQSSFIRAMNQHEHPEGGCSEKPNNLQEQPEVDLDKEIRDTCRGYRINDYHEQELGKQDIENIARHFYELGRARKEE